MHFLNLVMFEMFEMLRLPSLIYPLFVILLSLYVCGDQMHVHCMAVTLE